MTTLTSSIPDQFKKSAAAAQQAALDASTHAASISAKLQAYELRHTQLIEGVAMAKAKRDRLAGLATQQKTRLAASTDYCVAQLGRNGDLSSWAQSALGIRDCRDLLAEIETQAPLIAKEIATAETTLANFLAGDAESTGEALNQAMVADQARMLAERRAPIRYNGERDLSGIR